jgi:hypothetical protein
MVPYEAPPSTEEASEELDLAGRPVPSLTIDISSADGYPDYHTGSPLHQEESSPGSQESDQSSSGPNSITTPQSLPDYGSLGWGGAPMNIGALQPQRSPTTPPPHGKGVQAPHGPRTAGRTPSPITPPPGEPPRFNPPPNGTPVGGPGQAPHSATKPVNGSPITPPPGGHPTASAPPHGTSVGAAGRNPLTTSTESEGPIQITTSLGTRPPDDQSRRPSQPLHTGQNPNTRVNESEPREHPNGRGKAVAFEAAPESLTTPLGMTQSYINGVVTKWAEFPQSIQGRMLRTPFTVPVGSHRPVQSRDERDRPKRNSVAVQLANRLTPAAKARVADQGSPNSHQQISPEEIEALCVQSIETCIGRDGKNARPFLNTLASLSDMLTHRERETIDVFNSYIGPALLVQFYNHHHNRGLATGHIHLAATAQGHIKAAAKAHWIYVPVTTSGPIEAAVTPSLQPGQSLQAPKGAGTMPPGMLAAL